MRKVRFGLVGIGLIAEGAHLPAIRNASEADLVAVCSSSESRAKYAAQRWGAKDWYTDYDKMLRNNEVDAIVVATSNFLHAKNSIAAAEAGKHILCEKPLAITSRDTREIVKVVESSGVKMLVGHDQRFWSQHEMAKRLVQDGVIGKVLACNASFRESYKLVRSIAASDFRWRIEKAGAGALFDLCTHSIDLLRYLAGEVTKAFGMVAHRAIPEEISNVDDNVLIMCQLENGGFGVIEGDRYTPRPVQATALYGADGTIFASSDGFSPFSPYPLAICTEKPLEDISELMRQSYYPSWDMEIGDKWASRFPSGKWLIFSPPRENPYHKQLEHFCDCILRDKKPRTTAEDGAKSVDIALAAVRSMETGTWVDLPLKEDVVPPGYVVK
jgi:UDP-N-acetylglucosamine 3-dehydrogenase